jgi:tRNA threonylcarbamoyladenosine biosynthesis protein TsaE
MTEQFHSHSLEETRRIARRFAAGLHKGDIVALSGDLGAGKTEFMRGITEFFVCEEQLSSPTFPLFNMYEGTLRGEPVTLHHFDLYRIKSQEELEAIGFDEYLSSAFLSVVEWADRFPEYNRFYTATVRLERIGEESRRIVIIKAS